MNGTAKKSSYKARYSWLAAIPALMALLVACGGGGGGSDASTSAASTGPISGFGSIIVNGVRIDNSTATTILDDDDTGQDSDLKLGMMVEVESDTDANGNPSRATAVHARSLVQGPISTINAAGNQFTVLGMTVRVTARTVFDGITGLASLNPGDGVEVHGIADASGGVKATRIERKASAVTNARVTGKVQSPDSSSFMINGVKVLYQQTNLVNLPNGVKAGMMVRVKGTLSSSEIVAAKVRAVRFGSGFKHNQRVEVEGIVTAFTSTTSFEVNGLAVTVPAGAKVEGTVAAGARVEVKGKLIDNVLVASKVKLEDEDHEDEEAHEIHGPIVIVDLGAKTFTMRNGSITVKFDGNTKFDISAFPNGASSLTSGLKIEIKGKVSGDMLLATSIRLDK
jgi:hypothetical protein